MTAILLKYTLIGSRRHQAACMCSMAKISSIDKARSAKTQATAKRAGTEGFTPCSQDMTICGDCEGNRAKNKCPRLKEWLANRQR